MVITHFPDLSYTGYDAASIAIERIKSRHNFSDPLFKSADGTTRVTFQVAGVGEVPGRLRYIQETSLYCPPGHIQRHKH